jgi:hypothetical protein
VATFHYEGGAEFQERECIIGEAGRYLHLFSTDFEIGFTLKDTLSLKLSPTAKSFYHPKLNSVSIRFLGC